MKIPGAVLAVSLMLLLTLQSQAIRRRPTPPSGYRYARRPIYSPRRAPNTRRIVRVTPSRAHVFPRPRIVPAKSIDDLRSRARTAIREACPRTSNVDVKSVIAVNLQRINSIFGGTYAVKSLQRWGREICSKCIGSRCRFDHNTVRVTAIISTVCRSRNCVCGVERYGPQMSCKLIGWTKPGRTPYNIEIECDGRKVWPPRSIVVPAGTVRSIQRITRKTTASVTTATTPAERESTSVVTATKAAPATTTTLIENAPEQTRPDDFDVSAEGPGSSERPAPIVLWDETTSRATVVYPDPVVTGHNNQDIEEEGFLQ